MISNTLKTNVNLLDENVLKLFNCDATSHRIVTCFCRDRSCFLTKAGSILAFDINIQVHIIFSS